MKRPCAETVVKIVAMCAELCGEDYRGILLGFPDLQGRHMAYWAIRRMHPHMSRSDTARLVGARGIYVQTRIATRYKSRQGKMFDMLIDGIVKHIRDGKPVNFGVDRQSRARIEQGLDKPKPKAKASATNEPSLSSLCKPLSATRLAARTAASTSADRLVDYYSGDRNDVRNTRTLRAETENDRLSAVSTPVQTGG